MINAYLLFALANFVLCMLAIFMCLCRLNSMDGRVIYRVRSEYSVYLSCALVSALQPFYGEWPRWGSIAMAGGLVFGLFMSAKAWQHGPPEITTGHGQLGD